MTTGAFATQAD